MKNALGYLSLTVYIPKDRVFFPAYPMNVIDIDYQRGFALFFLTKRRFKPCDVESRI